MGSVCWNKRYGKLLVVCGRDFVGSRYMGSDRIWEVSEFVGRVWGNKSAGK